MKNDTRIQGKINVEKKEKKKSGGRRKRKI